MITPDGQVLVGSAGTTTESYSLDPATGRENWAAPLVANNHWVASPLVVGDTVYAANNNGALYAAELATGFLNGRCRSTARCGARRRTNGKLIFVTSLDHTLYAVDPESARSRLADGPGRLRAGSATVSAATARRCTSAPLARRSLRSTPRAGRSSGRPTPRTGSGARRCRMATRVFAADISGRVYSLGATHGKNAWPSLQPDGAITASPVVLPDGVLVATEVGQSVRL